MRTGPGRAAGAFAVATVVLAGVWLWTASDGEEPPPVVASVQLVEDDDARASGERPPVRTVRPDGDGLTTLQPSAGDGAAARPGEPIDLTGLAVGGYEGWWSAGDHGEACDAFADAHPEVVLVSTRTGAVVESYVAGHRLRNPRTDPPGDPAAWPAGSVVVLDARTGEVLDAFEVDESGWRLDVPVDCIPPSETP